MRRLAWCFSMFFVFCLFVYKSLVFQHVVLLFATKRNKAKIKKTKILRNKNGTNLGFVPLKEYLCVDFESM